VESVNWQKLIQGAAEAGSAGYATGPHLAEVETVEMKEASTGKQMVVIKFRFLGGPNDGKKLTRNFVITPDSPPGLAMFFRQMAALGAPKEFFAAGPSPEQVGNKLVGTRCMAKVKMGKWQGEDRAEIEMISAVQGGVSAVPGVPAVPAPPSVSTAPTAHLVVSPPPPAVLQEAAAPAPVTTIPAPPAFPDGI
jgi:hypothetical protein